MREQDFEVFLTNDPAISSKNAIAYRIAKARKVEEILGKRLDSIVSDDDVTYEALLQLRPHEYTDHAPLQNALRKYYKFIHGREFPRLRDYHSAKHP